MRTRRAVLSLSTTVVALVLIAGLWFAKWGVLRVRVAFAEEETMMFEECLRKARQCTTPETIAGYLQAAIVYYPSGSKQIVGSHLDRMVERSRRQVIEDLIDLLRQVSRTDFGADPQKWIEHFAKGMSQSVGAETNPAPGASGSGR